MSQLTPPEPSLPDALINFDSLPDSASVRLPVVCGLLSRSPASVWRDVKAGRLPAPHKVGPRSTVWNVGDLRQLLAGFREAA